MRKMFSFVAIILFPFSLYAQVHAVDSTMLKSLELRAKNFANSGNYDSAAVLAKQIIGMGARDSSIYYMTALVLTLDGKKDEGKLYYDTALAKGYDPNTSAAIMLGLSQPFAKTRLNLDSAFAAIDAHALRASRHLPKGYKNAKLYRIYDDDQGERKLLMQEGMQASESSGLILKMAQHDAIRKKELYAMLPELKKTRATGDLEEAGLILQHGNDTADYWNAHELAMRAVHLGDTNALWLAAATLDRYLVKQGKPQRYGTQSTIDPKTGKIVLAPVDPTVTDAERAKWHVPSLRDALKLPTAAYGK